MHAFITVLVYSIVTILRSVRGGHYQGGTITWRPVDEYATGSSIWVLIQQKHTWTFPRFNCTPGIITDRGLYFDANAPTTYPRIQCLGSCTSTGGFRTIYNNTYCTDYNLNTKISTGAYYEKQFLSRTARLNIGYTSNAWAGTIPIVNGGTSSYGLASWSIVAYMDLTGSGTPINSSPVTGSLGLIKVIRNKTATIQIPFADWNTGNTLRCRWATTFTECGDICGDLSQYGATLGTSDCTINWVAQLRPQDAAWGYVTSTYVAAIMVEDFANATSTTRLSAVPLQMIVYVYTPASGACYKAPEIIGDRPNRACIGVPINVSLTERIVAEVYCNDTLSAVTQFVSTSPLWMTKTSVAQVPGKTNQYYIMLTWTPVDDQYGPQVFCAAPIDGRGLTGSQYCINFVVGLGAPNLIQSILVQGSASPLGTVFSNHSLFSIQATESVHRPNRNGTYISIYLSPNNTLAWQADAGYSSDVLYSGNTVSFIVQNPSWVFGGNYYILFSSGTASGTAFCGPESAPITDPTFWRFNVWDSSVSSTTTTTTITTPPTVPIVTTRPPSTTTANTLMTTTGIIVTTQNITTMTTQTMTTTVTVTTTTAATATTTVTIPSVTVISPKDLEESCKQPVAVMTALGMVAVLPLKMIGMFVVLSHITKLVDPNGLQALSRQMKRMNSFS